MRERHLDVQEGKPVKDVVRDNTFWKRNNKHQFFLLFSLGGSGRDQCIQNQPHGASRASIIEGFWKKQDKKPKQKQTIKKIPNKPLYPPSKKKKKKPTPYYMLISGACQVLTKFRLACGPRILDLIRSLDAFVLGALTFFWETRF